MSAENASWSLLHIESKLQIDSLSTLQAQALVQSFEDSEFAKWAAWCDGLPDWQLLEDVLGTLGVTRKPKPLPPPVLPPAAPVAPPKPPPFTGAGVSTGTGPSLLSTPSFTIPLQPETLVTQTNTGVLNPDGRLSKRVAKRYKVYIGTKGKMHETMTVDLSLNGLQVVDGIPAGNDGHLEVALVNSKGENLALICAVLPDERRNRLKIVRAGKLDQLHQWLTNNAD